MKMKTWFVFVLCVSANFVNGLTSEEVLGVTDTCCAHAETAAVTALSPEQCAAVTPPDDLEPEEMPVCVATIKSCCTEQFKNKEACDVGIKTAATKTCSSLKDIGKVCCDECLYGISSGKSLGKAACGSPGDVDDFISPSVAYKNKAFYQCCLEGANIVETTTKKPETTTQSTTTTQKIVTTTKKMLRCKRDSCDQNCDDEGGVIKCSCNSGYRLQADKKTCKDINECAEATDDLCTSEDTVCHNTAGSFKCVPIKKRDVGNSCPPGFMKNVINQVCDDINECQLPRPPCPKYLCENTIGAYKCAGKPGKPFTEAVPGAVTEGTVTSTSLPKNDICPPGFRAGEDEECLDIDECRERLDDCQRLSQHCINTHGSYFCQDHVSKRCAPGFKVNTVTGICEDIDECEESSEVCQRTEVCVNLPGAYNCKSKISTLPRLATKTCQEGTRLRPGGTVCEDIDECREQTHLCDQFQNCINTFGGHECRCKNGFELDSSSGSCVDIDECALKLDDCHPSQVCLNLLGTFTCTRRSATSTTTIAPPLYEYEYYDTDDESPNGEGTYPETIVNIPNPANTTPVYKTTSTTTSTTPRTTTRPATTPRTTTTSTTTTPRPTTTSSTTTSTTTTPRPTTTSTTTMTPRPTRPVYPYYTFYPTRARPEATTTRRPEYPRRDYPNRYDPNRDYPRRPETTSTTTARPALPPEQPDDRRMNEIGEGGPGSSGFNIDDVHCLYGYVKDSEGNCVDDDECATGQNACRNLEMCVNQPGGYVCECIPGFRKNSDDWCVPINKPNTTTSTTTSTTTTSTTTTEAPATPSPPERRPRPRPRPRPYGGRYPRPKNCELGYTYDPRRNQCTDIDECAMNIATCSASEDCVNIPGGFRCECGPRCRETEQPNTYTPSPPTTPTTRPSSNNTSRNVITVGAQYGQRGPYSLRPNYNRASNSEGVVLACPWGYRLTPEKRCYDIDECSQNISECGPEQTCENFYGGYSCQCSSGYRLVGQNRCEDINECIHGTPCPYNADCMNTQGSYHCVCRDGFRNAPSNDKVCIDLDECSETPGICSQSCSNTWGSYRCYCKKGYRLDDDGKTCVDVNECEEYSSVRLRGKLCGGECINEPGSYRCDCPRGYRLSEDRRSCIDIDECETGEARCGTDPGVICQNTRGSYHCHHIDCPHGYRLEGKHRCSRVQRSCQIGDWTCLQQPSSYSYNFITFVANIYLPTGSVDLFTMHGPSWSESVVSFEMRMLDVQASHGVRPADFRCFDMRPTNNVCVISLLCPLEGPQVVELELTMSLYQRSMFAGSAVARLVVIVSQYEF